MCGIAGCVVSEGAAPSRNTLRAMASALEHRGPDDAGIAIEGNTGLVCTRLAIVDPGRAGRQPMTDPSGGWLLAYNGEVFNHLELRAELPGVAFAGRSDTETVAAAIARWGPSAFSRFSGMFALAALDRSGRRLLLARDRVGVKPLYTARDERGFWFASEPGALVAAGLAVGARRQEMARAIEFFYANGRVPPLQGVSRVEPGTVLSISLDSLSVQEETWFDPQELISPERQARLAAERRNDLVDRLERELRHAVHSALMADVEVGVLCSGGLDSSTILALAREASRDVRAFAARHRGDGRLDEGPAAHRAAAALGVQLEMVEITPSWWRRLFVEATLHYGAPVYSASAVVVAGVARHAREAGIKVLLSGEGADELFGGYGFAHRAAFRAFLPLHTLIRRRLEQERLRGPAGALLHAARRTGRPDLAPIPGGGDDRAEAAAIAAGESAYVHHSGSRRRLEGELLANLKIMLPALLDRMDRMGMKESVEIRVPFLEPGVIELALTLPLEARTTPRVKGALRDVGRRLLGRRIAYRPKIYGMRPDAGVWIEEAAPPRFLGDGRLRELLGVSRSEWEQVVTTAVGDRTVRLWSGEILCRWLAGEHVESIERELWPHGV